MRLALVQACPGVPPALLRGAMDDKVAKTAGGRRPRGGPGAHAAVGAFVGLAIGLLVEPPFHSPGAVATALLALMGAAVGVAEWARGGGAARANEPGGPGRS